MNRGSHARRGPAVTGDQRFNEAPIHESGKSLARARMGLCARRFNEAPIHESGKWNRRRWRKARVDRFNEAPIHESGKSYVRHERLSGRDPGLQ